MSQHRDAHFLQQLVCETRKRLDVMVLEPVALERLEILCQPEIRKPTRQRKRWSPIDDWCSISICL